MELAESTAEAACAGSSYHDCNYLRISHTVTQACEVLSVRYASRQVAADSGSICTSLGVTYNDPRSKRTRKVDSLNSTCAAPSSSCAQGIQRMPKLESANSRFFRNDEYVKLDCWPDPKLTRLIASVILVTSLVKYVVSGPACQLWGLLHERTKGLR